MAMFFGIIGMLGVPACLIWLIVCFVRWDSKKPPLIGMLACAALFIVGSVMYEPSADAPPEDTGAVVEPEEGAQRSIPVLQNTDSEQSTSLGEGDSEGPASGEEDGPLSSGDYSLPCGVKLHFFDSVRNDVTGRWRRSGTTSSLAPMDFAAEYYETLFSSDDEIHSVWNASLNTTTKISTSGGLLFVDTYEYVKGEEQDANLMFSGELLDSRIIDLATGEPLEEIEPVQEAAPEPPADSKAEARPESSQPAPASETIESPKNEEPASPKVPISTQSVAQTTPPSGGGSNNFNTYDIPEQQQTDAQFVLNISSMKIHYPSCKEVRKIKPENYRTSNLSESELLAQGYTTCGACH